MAGRKPRPGAPAAAQAALATLAALALAAIAVPGAAWAEDPEPFTRSSATTYRVTFAARACASYADVMANQVRDDAAESPGRPGKDSRYKPGQPVAAGTEAEVGCDPMVGARFTLGSGREKKGEFSGVTGPGEPVATTAEAPRLDSAGQPDGGQLAGSVTVALTAEQVRLASRRQLWAQGGAPGSPVPGGHAFAALRCAIDGRTGGNVQWIAFPPGAHHAFCFAYYVRGATDTGSVTVKLRTTRPVGYPQRVVFESTLSHAGSFTMAADGGEASFVRLPGVPHRLQPKLPAGWRIAEATCVASKANTDPETGRADLTLVAGESASCGYAVEPPAVPAGLTIRAYAEGGAATFGVTVSGSGREHALSVAPRGDGSAATASGADLGGLAAATYTVTTRPPATEAALWSLAGAACNGAPVTVQDWALKAVVGAGVPTECVVRLARKQGVASLKVVTTGGVATAGFALVPADTAWAGWSATATTAKPGNPTAATGDLPAVLPFGSYLVLPVAPLSTVDASWRLTAFGCQPGGAAGAELSVVRVGLTAAASTVECTAAYEMVPVARLHLAVRVEGAGRPAVVVDVACADGSAGRVVLPAEQDGPTDLPEPLAFAEKTNCTVSLADNDGAERPRVASLVVESAPGNAPLSLPATVALDGPGDEVRLAATLHYGRPADDERRAGALGTFQALPFTLIGAGLIGIGIVVLLVLVARRRMGHD